MPRTFLDPCGRLVSAASTAIQASIPTNARAAAMGSHGCSRQLHSFSTRTPVEPDRSPTTLELLAVVRQSANASISLYTLSATGNTTETQEVEMQHSAPYMARPDRDLALINQPRPYRIYGWALSR